MIFVFGRPPGLGAPFLRGLGLGVGGGGPFFVKIMSKNPPSTLTDQLF